MSNDELSLQFFHIFSYFHPNNQKVAALNLWTNGHRIFINAKLIKDFDTFEAIPCGEYERPELAQVMPFMIENIIDKTRIITCFENFMKGVLMLQGFVVHKLSKKNTTLRNHQNSRPVRIAEVFTETSFTQFDAAKIEEHETTDQTIGFSTLLMPKYQEVLQIPKELLELLKEVNAERNKLHFITVTDFAIGKPIIENMRMIVNFVATVMVPQVLKLNQNMQYIKLKMSGRPDLQGTDELDVSPDSIIEIEGL